MEEINNSENAEYENIVIQEEDGFMVVGEFIGLV